MQKKDLPNLPDSPGVYLFKKGKSVLYIGRATSLKDRVKSYFGDDLLNTRGPIILDMVTSAKTLDFIETASVLEAVILEANLIKKYQPIANTKEKDDKSFYFVVFTNEELPKIILSREKDLDKLNLDIKEKFGPFTSGQTIKEALKILRKFFPFQDDSSSKKDQFTFYRQLGLVPDISKEEMKNIYLKNIENLILFFQGKKDKVLKNLEKEMFILAKKKEFEKANLLKQKIFALKHIKDVSLIKQEELVKKDKMFRVEAYDISHMSGGSMVGVMTVVENGVLNKNEYRKFKIKGFDKSNDVGALEEVVKRRLGHIDWQYPNLVVVDGSTAQKRRVENIFNELGIQIPVVAVVKDERHKPKAILGNKKLASQYEKEIILTNAEAHRFSINFHKDLRGKRFLSKKIF